jgi:NAD(P)-dependent dehydrogenase (short-subunit alcohol dehydrogenase family)
MTHRAAIVTGGLRGLGRAMALGLAEAGHDVLAVGHIAADIPLLQAELAGSNRAGRVHPMLADLRAPAACDAVVAAAGERLGGIDILVNCAGLTFTTVWPDLYRREVPPKFWQLSDEIVQSVMDTNYVAADQMARRVAPLLVARGWGRIINVTTRIETMTRPASSPYGPSKAALEMATQSWAQETTGTGVTVNILNPGAGANTEGIAEEVRQANREGKMALRLTEPEEMVPPLLWLVSAAADQVNGQRFDANRWDKALPPEEAARGCGRPAGFVLRPAEG